jgi:hypothetical protein
LRKVAILQSNYIPWKGYFDLIHDVDLCIFYDCVQYTRQTWRNRNQIYVGSRKRWLSIPVRHAGLHTPIRDILIDNRKPWQRRHFQALREAYGSSPHFEELSECIRPFLGEDGRTQAWERLSEFNQAFLAALRSYLGIATECVDSFPLALNGRSTARVLDALRKVGASHYVSGAAARAYLDEEAFKREGIDLAYKDYSGYPAYPQHNPAFDHQVSILDLLFRVGRGAPHYIWGWRA